MNMVDKVAKAFADNSIFVTLSWDLLDERVKEEWRKQARIGINAMRDPTEEMVEMKVRLRTGDDCREDTGFEWQMMIDIALKE